MDMQTMGYKIHLVSLWLPQLHWQHGLSIMDVILNSSHMDTSQIAHMNWCQLFMQHYYLSGITSADGKYLAHCSNDYHPPVSLQHNS
eukprot:13301703-Ditylum_brightwellii.AAC.1